MHYIFTELCKPQCWLADVGQHFIGALLQAGQSLEAARERRACMEKVSTTSRPLWRAFSMPPLSARSAAEPAAMGYSPPTP